MADREATLRAAWLGTALRELRENAGLNVRQLGVAYGRNHGTISRIETGLQPARETDVLGYLEACHVIEQDKRARLLGVAAEVNERGWWDGYKGSVSGTLIDRLWLEDRATSIRSFETMVLPGLLQTPGYAEHLIRTDAPDAPDDQVKQWCKVRMTRQHILVRHQPAAFISIIDESVLRRPVGSRPVMVEQLDYLIATSERKNVDVRVLPTSAGYCGSAGAFVVLDLEDPFPRVAYTQTPMGDVCVEGDDAHSLQSKYGHLLDNALNVKKSKQAIVAVRKSL